MEGEASSVATGTAESYSGEKKRRICLVGDVVDDQKVLAAAKSFCIPIITSETGSDYVLDKEWLTYFIMTDFEGPMFKAISKSGHRFVIDHFYCLVCVILVYFPMVRILGPPALEDYAAGRSLPTASRPIYNLSMKGAIIGFEGFRERSELVS